MAMSTWRAGVGGGGEGNGEREGTRGQEARERNRS